jgi:predicted dehydrogenase
MVRHNHRFMPVRRSAKRIIETGGIGEPYLLRSTCIASPDYILARPWYGQKQQGHGGVLLGNAIHHLDLFRWYGGEVRRVAALGSNKVIAARAGMDAEDTALLVCEFEGGALGQLLFTDAEVTDKAGIEQVEVYGTEGWLAVSFNCHNHGVSSRIFGDGEIHALPPAEGLGAETEFAHFLRCLDSGEAPLTSGPEARKALELVIAGYQSMMSGGFVTLPLDRALA